MTFVFDEKVQEVIDKLSNDKSAGAINGSGVGSGKTACAVQVALNRGAKRVLIIAPPNTFDGWFDHIKWIAGAELKYCGNQSLKFTHAPDVNNRLARKTLTVTKAQAQANLTGALGGDEGWFFVSRELFVKMDWQKQPEIRNGRPVLTKTGKPKFKNVRLNVWGRSKKSHWDLVGYDECQQISNKDSAGNKSFRYSLSADYKLVMSADWFGNKLENMYGVATAIWGKLPYTFTYFKTRYFHTEYDPFTYDKVKISKKGELVAGAFVKTLPTYVALPSGVVQPEAIPVSVELTRAQRKLYSQLERTMATELESGDVLVTEIPLITRMRLRELALGEFDIAGYSVDAEGNKKPIIEFPIDAPSAKLDELLRLLKEYEGESFLVYTHSKKFANKTVEWLRGRGIKTDSITSDTTDKARVKDGFLNRDFRVLVCTSAIAVGVDSLQFVCRNLVFLSEDENALNNGQVIGRIARRGQSDVVNVWKLVARDTVDVEVYDNLILRAIANNRSKTLAQSGNIK